MYVGLGGTHEGISILNVRQVGAIQNLCKHPHFSDDKVRTKYVLP